MARSYRHNPGFGISKAASDKPYKRQEHGRERAAVRTALYADRDPPDRKAFGDRWCSPKDGKQWWAKATMRDMRK